MELTSNVCEPTCAARLHYAPTSARGTPCCAGTEPAGIEHTDIANAEHPDPVRPGAMGRLVLGLLSAMALKRLEAALEHEHDVITVDPVLFLIYL